MSKTPMQKLIDYMSDDDAQETIMIRRMAKSLLEEERNNIINAWEEGELFGERVERDGMTYKQVMERRNEFIKNQNI